MKEDWKDYFYKGLAVFLTFVACILFFFDVFRFRELQHYVGMVIGVPIFAFFYQLVKEWVRKRLEKQKLMGETVRGND